jgi:hypothetical protein
MMSLPYTPFTLPIPPLEDLVIMSLVSSDFDAEFTPRTPWRGIYYSTLMTIRGGISTEVMQKEFHKATQHLEDRHTLPDSFENDYSLEKGGMPWDEGVSPVVGNEDWDLAGDCEIVRVFWIERRAASDVNRRAVGAG